MSSGRFRRAALALPGAVEGAHQGTADFRVGKRIFATLGYPDDAWGMVKLTQEQQSMLARGRARNIPSGSGRMGQAGLHQCAARKGRCDHAAKRAQHGMEERRAEGFRQTARDKAALISCRIDLRSRSLRCSIQSFIAKGSSKLGAATPWDVPRASFVRATFQPGMQNVHCLQLVSVSGEVMRKDHVNGRVPPYQAKNTRRREPNLRQEVRETDARTGAIPAHVRHFQSVDVFCAHAAHNSVGSGQLAMNGGIRSSQLSDVQENLII